MVGSQHTVNVATVMYFPAISWDALGSEDINETYISKVLAGVVVSFKKKKEKKKTYVSKS